jgi:alpha-L-rhamnosidase
MNKRKIRNKNKTNQVMNNVRITFLIFILTLLSVPDLSAQKDKWRKGILLDEFIYNEAPFPQAHASTIAETPDGLIAAWFGGTREGNKDVCIWTSRLENNKWTAPEKVAEGIINDTLRYACYNPVLFYAPNKEVLLFYKIGPNVAGWTGWMMRSKDNGRTWSKREALPEGFLGPIKNKPIIINNTLICPSSTEKNGWKVHFEYTNDFGKTWTKSADINDGIKISAIQPSILTYKDGSIQILCRSKNRTINESWSTDGGKTWSEMKPSSLPNNNSGTDAVTLKDGRQLLVYNHVKPADSLPNGKGARTPLNVAISKDGKHWDAVLILEDSPISQYSYPSVIQSKDGMVHIVYTWRREKIKYVKIDPKKLAGKPIINEQWPGGLNVVSKPSDD